jgi:hypothetical protein
LSGAWCSKLQSQQAGRLSFYNWLEHERHSIGGGFMTKQQIDNILANEGTQTGQTVSFNNHPGIITGVKADCLQFQFNYRPVQFNRIAPELAQIDLVVF